MRCTNCGAEIPAESKFCSSCGQPVPVQQTYPQQSYPQQNYQQQPYPQQAPVNYGYSAEPMNEKTFYKTYMSKNARGWVTATIVCAFISAALNIANVALYGPASLLDAILCLVIGIVLIKKKSWVLPLIFAIYGIIVSILSLVLSGTPSGILAIAAGIISVIKLRKFAAAYKQYKNTGLLPMDIIK